MRAWITHHQLAAFFFIAFLFSWTIEISLIASQSSSLKISLPMGIHYLASLGPMTAAFIVTWISGGYQGLKEIWARITKWRVEGKWIAFAMLSLVIFFIFGTLVNFFLTSQWPDLSRIGQVNYLPNLGLGALILWLVTFGFGEEIGWRGFALPRLQNKHNALSATFILGIAWIVWHIPTFFYHETYLEMGTLLLFGMAIGILLGGVMLTWLYNSSKGSILIVAVWHALFDFFSASQSNGPWVAPIISFCIIFLAIRILKVYPAQTLSASAKQIQ